MKINKNTIISLRHHHYLSRQIDKYNQECQITDEVWHFVEVELWVENSYHVRNHIWQMVEEVFNENKKK